MKIINRKKIFLTTISILFLSIIYAKNTEHNLTPEEIDFKLKIIEDINTKILNSIYWTIALVGAIFSAIIALNFYQNFTINTKKIEAIKNELNKSNSDLKDKLKIENDKIINDNVAKINTIIEQIAESKFKELQTKFNKLESDYKDLKRENLIIKAEKHKEKGQRGYLISYIEILQIDMEKKYDWRIFESLEKINEIIKEGKPNLEDSSKLLTEIDKLPKKFETIVTAIRSNIKID